jgi:hypothetical protein
VSIEEWFDRIDDAIDTAYRVDADYHDDWGFPTAVFVDVDDMTADEEWGMVFDGFADRTEVLRHLVNRSFDCGYGFWASTPDQGVSIELAFAGPPDAGVSDVAELDDARVLIGSDLMANWCDDVMEPGEPVAEIAETWAVTGGTIEIAFESDAVAVATLTGIVATTPDGQEIVLGDGTYRNEAWGVFAG